MQSSQDTRSPSPRKLVAFLWTAERGGAELFTVELLRRLRERGFLPHVVFLHSGGPLSALLEAEGISTSCGAMRHELASWLRPRWVRRQMPWSDPDAVLLSAPGVLGVALRMSGYRGRMIAVEHGMFLSQSGLKWWRRLLHAIDRAVGGLAANRIVAVSDAVVAHLVGRVPRRKVLRIYNGVDTVSFSPGSPDRLNGGDIVFGAAGRLIPEKSFNILIDAFSEVCQTENALLKIAGDGPCRGELEQLVQRLRISDKVEFLGLIDDMPEFWRSVEVAVVPSSRVSEAFGLVAAEAAASGLPAVAARRGALPEIIDDGRTGLLFEPGSRVDLADKMRAYSNCERVVADGSRARARALENWNMDAAVERYAAVLSGERS